MFLAEKTPFLAKRKRCFWREKLCLCWGIVFLFATQVWTVLLQHDDGAVVPLGVGSLGLGDEGLIMPVCFGILLDRGGPGRLLVLPDVLRNRELDEPPLVCLDALQPVAQLVPDAAILQCTQVGQARRDEAVAFRQSHWARQPEQRLVAGAARTRWALRLSAVSSQAVGHGQACCAREHALQQQW